VQVIEELQAIQDLLVIEDTLAVQVQNPQHLDPAVSADCQENPPKSLVLLASEGVLVETEGTDAMGLWAARVIEANQDRKGPLVSEEVQAVKVSEERKVIQVHHRLCQVHRAFKACLEGTEETGFQVRREFKDYKASGGNQVFKACQVGMEETAFRARRDQKATLARHRLCLVRRGSL
jgi:hypothetical protein